MGINGFRFYPWISMDIFRFPQISMHSDQICRSRSQTSTCRVHQCCSTCRHFCEKVYAFVQHRLTIFRVQHTPVHGPYRQTHRRLISQFGVIFLRLLILATYLSFFLTIGLMLMIASGYIVSTFGYTACKVRLAVCE